MSEFSIAAFRARLAKAKSSDGRAPARKSAPGAKAKRASLDRKPAPISFRHLADLRLSSSDVEGAPEPAPAKMSARAIQRSWARAFARVAQGSTASVQSSWDAAFARTSSRSR